MNWLFINNKFKMVPFENLFIILSTMEVEKYVSGFSKAFK